MLMLMASSAALLSCSQNAAPPNPAAAAASQAGTGVLPVSGAAAPQQIALSKAQALAGLCSFQMLTNADVTTCRMREEHAACAAATCRVSECEAVCSSYTDCVAASPMKCNEACMPSAECGDCVYSKWTCAFVGACGQVLKCGGEEQANGYCAQFRQCCMKQGELAQTCLNNVSTVAGLNGEPGCRGAQADPDILRQLLVPCDFTPFDEKTGPPPETRVLLFSRTTGMRLWN